MCAQHAATNRELVVCDDVFVAVAVSVDDASLVVDIVTAGCEVAVYALVCVYSLRLCCSYLYTLYGFLCPYFYIFFKIMCVDCYRVFYLVLICFSHPSVFTRCFVCYYSSYIFCWSSCVASMRLTECLCVCVFFYIGRARTNIYLLWTLTSAHLHVLLYCVLFLRCMQLSCFCRTIRRKLYNIF